MLQTLQAPQTTSLKNLYPYQVEDTQWLLQHPTCILGSEMGVGKTVEVLSLAHQIHADQTLVICPKPLIPEWEYQIEQWLGPSALPHFVVMNYEKLRNPEFVYRAQKVKWDLVAFDECHKLKNPKAKQTKGAYLITPFTKRTILMSGTPLQNGPQDLFSLLHIINPLKWNSYNTFIEHYCTFTRLPMPPFARVITGPKNSAELSDILKEVMIRRTKAEVLPQLPPKVFRTIPITLDDNQLRRYTEMEEEFFTLLDSGEKVEAVVVIARMIRLRQICLDPNLMSPEPENRISTPSAKTLTVIELASSTTEQIIVYTWFERYAKMLVNDLRVRDFKVSTYTGQTKDDLSDFRTGKTQILVGTIGSIGLGLNLQNSHIGIFTDQFWNPAVNNQAIDRQHRAGQLQEVQVIDLWAKDTVEDAMHRVLARKQKIFDEIVAVNETIKELRQMRKNHD